MRLSSDVQRLLKESGLEWSVESGARHTKVYVEKRLVAIFPRSRRKLERMLSHSQKNSVAQIKRAIKHRRQQ